MIASPGFARVRAVTRLGPALVFVALVGCVKPPEPATDAKPEPPAKEPPPETAGKDTRRSKPVPSFSEAMAKIDGAKKVSAQLGCHALNRAAEVYRDSPSNPDGDLPKSLADLIKPPFGGPSLLKRGEDDLTDPWGNRYQMEIKKRSDGELYLLFKTAAPDGTLISQFGTGPNADPKK